MNARGFTLVELLVAAALVLVVAAALSGLAHGMQRAFDRSLSSNDLTARARSGLAAVAADVQRAGSGLAIGPAGRDLSDLMPVVVPQRSFDNAAVMSPFAALTIVYASGGQGTLLEDAAVGSTTLRIDLDAPSTRQDGTAGLERGDLALVFDTHRRETVTVAGVDAGAWTITLQSPLRHRFDAGAWVAAIERTTYGLKSDASGTTHLFRRTTAGAEQPVVDHVSGFEVSIWGVVEPAPYGPAAPPIGEDDDRDSWPSGENCTTAIDGAGRQVPRLVQLGAPATLIALTAPVVSDGPWCADAPDPEVFDADLLRVNRVDLHLQATGRGADTLSMVKAVSLFMSVALRQR